MKIEYIIGLGVLLVCIYALFYDSLPKMYRQRRCMGKKWVSTFPESSKADIREFLQIFVDAFAFSSRDKLQFEPNDKILDIYNAVYSSRWAPDVLELETFVDQIETQYRCDLSQYWHQELTLGELFSRVKTS